MPANSLSEKIRKKCLNENKKRMKPGECEKYVRAVIDETIMSTSVGKSLVNKLLDENVKCDIRKLPNENIIIWERNVGQLTLTEENFADPTDEFVTESQLIRYFPADEFLKAIHDNSIDSTLEKIKFDFPQTKITLIVSGLTATGSRSGIIERETIFADLQIRYECNIQVIPSSANEFAKQILRFTKAIAQIPFKKQESQIFADSHQFLRNDNRDCVRVNGENGMSRLWQQHLVRLPLVTLQVADAIRSEFTCPKSLLETIGNSSQGIERLANIKITRGGNILANDRRVGEALSKKLHTLYYSVDPTETL